MRFVESGLLEVLSEDEAERTIEFHIPSKRVTDIDGRITTYSLTWIHPDYADEFGPYKPMAANFIVCEDTTDVGDEELDLESLDELVAWLEGVAGSRV